MADADRTPTNHPSRKSSKDLASLLWFVLTVGLGECYQNGLSIPNIAVEIFLKSGIMGRIHKLQNFLKLPFLMTICDYF
jgi:hypothetical protein